MNIEQTAKKYDVINVLSNKGEHYLGYVTAYNCDDALKIARYKFGLGTKGLLQVTLNPKYREVTNE